MIKQNLFKVSFGYVFGTGLLILIQTWNPWIISLIQMAFFTGLYTLLDILTNKRKKKKAAKQSQYLLNTLDDEKEYLLPPLRRVSNNFSLNGQYDVYSKKDK